MRVRLSSRAKLDFHEALDYYAAVDDDGRAAENFLAEVEQAKRSISERPRAWTEIEPNVRQKILGKYPFALLYEIRAEGVWVLALAHHNRRHGYWRK